MVDLDFLRKPVWLISGLALAAFAVFGSPFLVDYLNSGDQLPPTLQLVDPQLFPNDAVVAAMAKLKSGFYLALAAAMKLFRVSPQQTESVIYTLFVVSKLLLIAGVFAVCRSLKNSFWLFVVFGAWCCHQKPALMGSVTLFMPIITHNEAALVLGLFAVACLLRGQVVWFWLLAGAMVLVHVILGLQFVLCVVPALLWKQKPGRNFLIGSALFAACCVVYLMTMAPPAMSAEEWRLFVSVNGNTAHISLLKHGWLDWFGFVSVFGLSLMAYDRFLKGDAGFELLRRAAIGGSAIGLALSAAAVATQAMKPMLFQPMRIFFWVTLICFLMIAAATVEAFSEVGQVQNLFHQIKKPSQLAGVLLASVLVLTVLNSILAPLLAFIGLVYFVLERYDFGDTVAFTTKTILALIVAAIFMAWALGDRQPIASLRSPALLLPSAICLVVLFFYKPNSWRPLMALPLILYCLTMASVYRHEYYQRWLDANWRAVRLWAQSHTPDSARFITPPDQVGFRVLALRTSASESVPRIVWSAPLAYLENKQAAERTTKAYANRSTDLATLFELAREWNCDYVIARGKHDETVTPLFRAGKFSVLKAPDQYRAR